MPFKPFPLCTITTSGAWKALRFKQPAEAERIDSHTDARNIVGIHLHLRQEITGIHETESQDLSGLFGGIRSFQSNERILVVAG